ncbi:hypothetical protein DOY81_011709 [Sarcophaga bullata]|nr:hypothetical protein DOY81_011709 [Sarcophaga bullata]
MPSNWANYLPSDDLNVPSEQDLWLDCLCCNRPFIMIMSRVYVPSNEMPTTCNGGFKNGTYCPKRRSLIPQNVQNLENQLWVDFWLWWHGAHKEFKPYACTETLTTNYYFRELSVIESYCLV